MWEYVNLGRSHPFLELLSMTSTPGWARAGSWWQDKFQMEKYNLKADFSYLVLSFSVFVLWSVFINSRVVETDLVAGKTALSVGQKNGPFVPRFPTSQWPFYLGSSDPGEVSYPTLSEENSWSFHQLFKNYWNFANRLSFSDKLCIESNPWQWQNQRRQYP